MRFKYIAIALALISSSLLILAQKPLQTLHENMSIEEISNFGTIEAVKKVATTRGIAYNLQTNEMMLAQHDPEIQRSLAFGGVGRLWLTFWIGDDKKTVHVSFFHSKEGVIVGRAIIIENTNIP